ncbi:DegV family protein [Fictibacillus barbaricus]|uniref:DegV family protein with EDD domain n=1 Tax=Fictibacillus barbaricus TaxID=182136 RepID=A0ABU1TXS3_9BACL|nr:DegV family protein [Fictibacillus barbaricus]MDR7072015.1 DegV family protein with EDD domain [Fictibacillus barbaricus]
MKLSFVVDSASDIKIDEEQIAVPLIVVPLNVQFGEDHYLDGVTITDDEFYSRMAIESELPKTSQPSPQSFFDTFKKEVDNGNHVLYIGLSSNLSGTVQSAAIAKGMLTEKEQEQVTIIDSGIASAGVKILLHEANDMLQNNASLQDILNKIEEIKPRIKGNLLIETIENLKKGGRISAVQGAIAGMLNIKPMISIQNGIVETIGKFRGSKKGIAKMKEMILEWKKANPGKALYIIHSLSSTEEVKNEFEDIFEFSSFPKVVYTRFGSTIGTYASEKAIGFVVY